MSRLTQQRKSSLHVGRSRFMTHLINNRSGTGGFSRGSSYRSGALAEQDNKGILSKLKLLIDKHRKHKVSVIQAKVEPQLRNPEGEQDDAVQQELEFKVKKNRFIIYPDSVFRMCWDFVILLLVLFYGITIPLKVGFDVDVISNQLDQFFTYCFVFDMVLNFRTAFKVKGQLITDWRKIGLEYLRLWFWIDLVAIVPLDALFEDSSAQGLNKIIRLIRIVKLFRVFRVARILKRFEEFSKLNPSIIRLLKMFILALFIWHWIACSYWFLSELEGFAFPKVDSLSEQQVNQILTLLGSGDMLTAELQAEANKLEIYKTYEAYNRDGGNLWVPPPELWCAKIHRVMCNESAFADFEEQNGFNPFSGVDYCFETGLCPASSSRKYIHCFFWAVMVTTGIGRDVMPVTPVEHSFSTVIIVVGVFMYAFIIGSASNSLSNWDAEKAERRQKLEGINQYLRQRNVPVSLQKRIRAFYDYLWSSQQNINVQNGLLSDLHKTLNLELHISLNRKIVESVSMFKIIRNSDCIIDLIEKLKPKIFIPGEYLLLQGEIGSEMYIISRGTVLVLVQSSSSFQMRQVGSITDGGVVGEGALLYRSRRAASVRAATYCDVLSLSKPDFDQVLKKYPEFRAAIHQMATQKARGWERVRSVIKMVKAVSYFGNQQEISELLLGKKRTLASEDNDEKDNPFDEKTMEQTIMQYGRKGRHSMC